MKAYTGSFGDDWRQFTDLELKRSNDLNSKSLGGQQPRNSIGDDDENDNHYEVNMEKIMARFTNFNQLITSSNDNQEEEQDEDKKTDDEGDEDHSSSGEDKQLTPEKKSPAKSAASKMVTPDDSVINAPPL